MRSIASNLQNYNFFDQFTKNNTLPLPKIVTGSYKICAMGSKVIGKICQAGNSILKVVPMPGSDSFTKMRPP